MQENCISLGGLFLPIVIVLNMQEFLDDLVLFDIDNDIK